MNINYFNAEGKSSRRIPANKLKGISYYIDRNMQKKHIEHRLPPKYMEFGSDSVRKRQYSSEYKASMDRLIDVYEKYGNLAIGAVNYFGIRKRLTDHEIVIILEDDICNDMIIVQRKVIA